MEKKELNPLIAFRIPKEDKELLDRIQKRYGLHQRAVFMIGLRVLEKILKAEEEGKVDLGDMISVFAFMFDELAKEARNHDLGKELGSGD